MTISRLNVSKLANLARKRTLSLIILALVLMGLVGGCGRSDSATVSKHESVYDRIMRTKKIRAAWLTYPPAVMKDTTTGKMTGAFADTLETVAKSLDLEVQWMDGETPWGALIEGLDQDKYDIVGSPVWANYVRGKLTTLSRPVYYSGIGIYVRKDDKRFPDDWAKWGTGTVSERNGLINKPGVRISTIDGETGDLIARTQFPQAQRVALPQNAEIPQLFLEVANNKADVLFAEPYFAYGYLKNNPGKVRNIAEDRPVRVLGNDFMMKKDEWQLKQMIDVAIEDLQNSGAIEGTLEKYESAPGQFYRVALPYRGTAGAASTPLKK